jgi:hypothetical protein
MNQFSSSQAALYCAAAAMLAKSVRKSVRGTLIVDSGIMIKAGQSRSTGLHRVVAKVVSGSANRTVLNIIVLSRDCRQLTGLLAQKLQ